MPKKLWDPDGGDSDGGDSDSVGVREGCTEEVTPELGFMGQVRFHQTGREEYFRLWV